MNLVSFLYGDKAGKIGEVTCDALIYEEHHHQAKIAEHPVENGSVITDHVQTLPLSVSVEGVISNTPLSYIIMPLKSTGNRAQEAFEQLEHIFAAREPIAIATTLKSYGNMVLESLEVKSDSRTQASLRFKCKARQIQIVGSKKINISNQPAAKHQPSKELGKQVPKVVSEATQAKVKSIAAVAMEKVQGLFK